MYIPVSRHSHMRIRLEQMGQLHQVKPAGEDFLSHLRLHGVCVCVARAGGWGGGGWGGGGGGSPALARSRRPSRTGLPDPLDRHDVPRCSTSMPQPHPLACIRTLYAHIHNESLPVLVSFMYTYISEACLHSYQSCTHTEQKLGCTTRGKLLHRLAVKWAITWDPRPVQNLLAKPEGVGLSPIVSTATPTLMHNGQLWLSHNRQSPELQILNSKISIKHISMMTYHYHPSAILNSLPHMRGLSGALDTAQ